MVAHGDMTKATRGSGQRLSCNGTDLPGSQPRAQRLDREDSDRRRQPGVSERPQGHADQLGLQRGGGLRWEGSLADTARGRRSASSDSGLDDARPGRDRSVPAGAGRIRAERLHIDSYGQDAERRSGGGNAGGGRRLRHQTVEVSGTPYPSGRGTPDSGFGGPPDAGFGPGRFGANGARAQPQHFQRRLAMTGRRLGSSIRTIDIFFWTPAPETANPPPIAT